MLIRFTGQVDTRHIERITFREDGGATVQLSKLDLNAMQIELKLLAEIKQLHGDTITGAQLRTLLLRLSDRNPDSSLQSDT